MSALDWFVVGVVVSISLVIGVIFTRRASSSTEEFFVAGRKLPWWVAGTSIVATTFSADTPLFISGMVRNQGLAMNWLWIYGAIGVMVGVFFFARLWRRTRVVTDAEFIELRYSGQAAPFLRAFRAGYEGVFRNCMILGSITYAMSTIVGEGVATGGGEQWLPWFGNSTAIIAALLIIAVVYSTMAGIVGVVYTDVIQFGIAMFGAFILAYYAVDAVGGMDALRHNLEVASIERPELTQMLPSMDGAAAQNGLPWSTFLVLILVAWWDDAPGRGYVVQRLLATKNERHSLGAMLWFAFTHYAVRPWPWIIVALASVFVMPDLAASEGETVYPKMIMEVLPAGLRGLLFASLFAAFMSTVDTHLNWGGSYAVNDLYRRFVRKDATDRHYVAVCRLAMVALAVLVAVVAANADSILDIYIYLGEISAGAGVVWFVRWYWWRVNAWSEISAMIAGVAIKYSLPVFAPALAKAEVGPDMTYGYRILINVIGAAVVWIAVTLWTTRGLKEPPAVVLEFYRRVRPRGPGWRWVQRFAPEEQPERQTGELFIGWSAGVVGIFAALYAVGSWVLFGSPGWIAPGLLAVSGILIGRHLRNLRKLTPAFLVETDQRE